MLGSSDILNFKKLGAPDEVSVYVSTVIENVFGGETRLAMTNTSSSSCTIRNSEFRHSTTRSKEAKQEGQVFALDPLKKVTNQQTHTIETIMAKETSDEQSEQCPRPPAHHLGKTVCGDVLASRLAQQQLHHNDRNIHSHSPCKTACSLVSGSAVVVENAGGEEDNDDDCAAAVILNHSKKGVMAAKDENKDGQDNATQDDDAVDAYVSLPPPVDVNADEDSTGPSRAILEVRYCHSPLIYSN
jgi:hypothetical protein